MDFDHLQPFLLGLRGQCTPLSLHRDPQTWSWVHPWNRSCVIQVYVQLNRSLMGPERSKKGDFAIFWPFFAIWGWIVNPHGPSSCFALLSLTATLLVTNSRKVSTTRNKIFLFFVPFWCFWSCVQHQPHLAKCHPPGSAPGATPSSYRPFHLYSVSLQWVLSPYAQWNWIYGSKSFFFLAEVKLPDLSHFEPFLPFLPGLRGQCAPLAHLANPQT